MDFLTGKLDLEKVLAGYDPSKYGRDDFENYTDGKEAPKNKHPLELLLPIKENFGDFLKYCEADLRSEKSQGPCRDYVGNAPRQFKETLIDRLLQRDPPSTNSSILNGLNFGYDKAYDEKVQGLYQKAVKICLQGSLCKQNDLASFFSSSFVTREQKERLSQTILARAKKGDFGDDLSSGQKDAFITYWRTMTELGDSSKTDTAKANRLKEDLLQQETLQNYGLKTSVKADESEAATLLRYSSILAKEGYQPKDLRAQIEQAIVKSQDFKVFIKEGDTLRESLKRIANSDSANEFAAYLSGPGNFTKMRQGLRGTSEFSSMVSRLLKSEKVDQKHKEQLLAELKQAVKSKEVESEFVFYSILKDNTEEPLVKAWVDEIKTSTGAAQYPGMAQAMLWASAQLDRPTPEFEKLLKANKSESSEWIFIANPKLSAENTTADRLIHSTFDRIIKNAKGMDDTKLLVWQWIEILDGKSMDKFGPTVVKALPSLLTAKTVPVERLYHFVQKLVENEGANRELMQQTIDTLRPFIRNEKFLWRANDTNIQTKKQFEEFESAGFDRGASILWKAYILLNDSKAGRKILKDHPVWQELKGLAKEKMRVDIPVYSSSLTADSASIPEPMVPFYVGKVQEQLRTLTDSTQFMGQLDKFKTEIISSPELIAPVIKRMGDLKEGSEAYRYLGALIVDFAKRSQQNARFILSKLGAMNPTYYHDPSSSSSGKTKPLKEELQRYLDYEK
jgi:hypothetical protein